MLRSTYELWSQLCLRRRVCQNLETRNLMGKPQEPMLMAVHTEVVTTWVHIGDVTDLLQDDAKIMGTIQWEQWGGPVAISQQANLGRSRHRTGGWWGHVGKTEIEAREV